AASLVSQRPGGQLATSGGSAERELSEGKVHCTGGRSQSKCVSTWTNGSSTSPAPGHSVVVVASASSDSNSGRLQSPAQTPLVGRSTSQTASRQRSSSQTFSRRPRTRRRDLTG